MVWRGERVERGWRGKREKTNDVKNRAEPALEANSSIVQCENEIKDPSDDGGETPHELQVEEMDRTHENTTTPAALPTTHREDDIQV